MDLQQKEQGRWYHLFDLWPYPQLPWHRALPSASDSSGEPSVPWTVARPRWG